eukprot:gene7559-10300_t
MSNGKKHAEVVSIEQARIHDLFNIAYLSTVVMIDLCYLVLTTDLTLLGTDLIGAFPIGRRLSSLLMPRDLLIHHGFTALLVVPPYLYPQYSWHMAICVAVEMNTLFMTYTSDINEFHLDLPNDEENDVSRKKQKQIRF